jgi:nitroreductase
MKAGRRLLPATARTMKVQVTNPHHATIRTSRAKAQACEFLACGFAKTCARPDGAYYPPATHTFMNTTIDDKLGLIFGRRSIRLYSPDPVSEAAVQKLLEAAMAAPSAVAKDPWRFVVIRNRDTLSEIATALPNGQMIATAALGIAVCGDLPAAHDQQLSYLLQDCSAAIENLLLCAHILGLGACWLGVHPRELRVNALKQILALPPSVIPVACIAIGHPAETKEPRTRFNPDYVHFDKW